MGGRGARVPVARAPLTQQDPMTRFGTKGYECHEATFKFMERPGLVCISGQIRDRNDFGKHFKDCFSIEFFV